jgi:fructose/tagatose bisphosphate aldolase
MALVPLRVLLDHAAEYGYGIPAFNVNNLEQIKAIMEAAKEVNSPVILQASRGARKYAGEAFLRHMVLAAVEEYPEIPIVMHQDHGNSPATCYSAIKNGFTSVMMDIAIGTSHGAYKFSRKPDGAILAIDRIREIHRKLPNTHLVMHGSSSVPQDLQDIINANGGAIPQTWGVPVEEIQEGIRNGVRKVNIDTDNRLAMTAAVREALAKEPVEFDPRKYLIPSTKAMQKICRERFVQFGCAEQANKIKQTSLDEIAKRYLAAASVKKAVTV